MKFTVNKRYVNPMESLLIQERGLKYIQIVPSQISPAVAPYTGAWIEISSAASTIVDGLVAPYTGAWIEIPRCPIRDTETYRSLLIQERGLKLTPGAATRCGYMSLLIQERGLKCRLC
ncbi:hypothetical protein PRIO_1416 [Paenibacillus riograndensis SBR5]|uniref:Uncharacterized protein n=1 Tax=Paenibacillus riograndensis SBR5 TaxID=1073571 RepID=A0A0E3WGN2_9BACL|nr:hypothetical protein PRIO_1416 [Paenibacillus riograndensis SBR5]